MRKLASIQKILEIEAIKDADLIVKATINGWQCVTQKTNFVVGDLAVYFEIDSFLPASDERFAFLTERSSRIFNGVRGHRLKTIKLKGVLAQGLLLPLSLFPEIQNPEEGMDVSELLGIEKWEMELAANLAGKASGSFPYFLHRTDQERVQNLPNIIKMSEGISYEESIKIDGSSLTAFHFETRIDYDEEKGRLKTGLCSRNLELKTSNDESAFCQTFTKYKLGEALQKYFEIHGRNLAIQGEIYGEGIQYNLEKVRGIHFKIFDIFDIDNQQYLLPVERRAVIRQLNELGFIELEGARVIDTEVHLDIFGDVKGILAEAEGPSQHNPDMREGVVFKSNYRDRHGNVPSFKAISNAYLLKVEKD